LESLLTRDRMMSGRGSRLRADRLFARRKELAVVRTKFFEDLALDDTALRPLDAAEELLRLLHELPDTEVQAKLSDLIVGDIARTASLPLADIDRNRPLSAARDGFLIDAGTPHGGGRADGD